jgi:nitrous oxidase accessory protein
MVIGCGETSREAPGRELDTLLQRLPVAGLLDEGRLDVGPAVQVVPAGASIPQDEQQLRHWLSDPVGPAEIWLSERVWHGDWQIRRKVALRGAGPGTVLEGTGTGTVLDVEADGATIENLTIVGTGSRHTSEDSAVRVRGRHNRLLRLLLDQALFGAALEGCVECSVERVHVVGREGLAEVRGDGIKVWESHGSMVRHCLVERSRDLVVWYSRNVTLDGNVVRGSRYGTHFMYAHDATVRGSAVIDNIVGIFVMYSARVRIEDNVLAGARGPAGVGLGFKDSDSVTVRGNWIVGNTAGMYVDQTPRRPEEPLLIEGNVLAVNSVGLRMHAQPHGVSIVANDVHENAEVAQVDGGGDATTARWSGNYWSDYAGFDLDGDGTGDVAWQIKRLSSELTDTHPTLKLFRGTVALATLDAVARAVPVLTTRLLLSDPSPAMHPHLLGHEAR